MNKDSWKILSDLPLTRTLHYSLSLLIFLHQFLPSLQNFVSYSSKYAAYSRLLSFSRPSVLPVLFMKNFFTIFSLSFFCYSRKRESSFPCPDRTSVLYSWRIPGYSLTLPEISSSIFTLNNSYKCLIKKSIFNNLLKSISFLWCSQSPVTSLPDNLFSILSSFLCLWSLVSQLSPILWYT